MRRWPSCFDRASRQLKVRSTAAVTLAIKNVAMSIPKGRLRGSVLSRRDSVTAQLILKVPFKELLARFLGHAASRSFPETVALVFLRVCRFGLRRKRDFEVVPANPVS